MQTDVDQKQEVEFAAYIAIDWADRKHVWRLQDLNPKRRGGEIDHTPEAVHDWAMELYKRYEGRPVAVCLEQARGPLINMLSKYEHLVLFPVHPTMLAKFREAFFSSGSKSDPIDTDLLLELLLKHRDRLKQLNPDTVETRLLQILVERRRTLVDDKTLYKNRLTQDLKSCFPQILNWFSDVATPLVGEVLKHWPTLEQLQKCPASELRDFLRAHNYRGEERINKLLEQIRVAIPATRDQAVLEGATYAIRSSVNILATLREEISTLERKIEEVAAAHPDFTIIDSFPGAGQAMVPRLIVAFGTDRERFASASDMQCYAGIAPVVESSGSSKVVHFRRACPVFLRQTFHEWAALTIPRSQWAREFYQRQIAKQKTHAAAVRALAFKWIRILYRCWKDRVLYDEARHLAAIQSRSAARCATV